MYKIKTTLLQGLLFASFIAFPVAGFSNGMGTGDSSDHLNVNKKPLLKETPRETQSSMDMSTAGFRFHRGRPYHYRPYYHYYPYRPYYYRYYYYPYRPYYYNYYRW